MASDDLVMSALRAELSLDEEADPVDYDTDAETPAFRRERGASSVVGQVHHSLPP